MTSHCDCQQKIALVATPYVQQRQNGRLCQCRHCASTNHPQSSDVDSRLLTALEQYLHCSVTGNTPTHLSVISMVACCLRSCFGRVRLVRVMLLVPLVLMPATLALLVLSPQLSLELAEALYLAAVCLKQPHPNLSCTKENIAALCNLRDRLGAHSQGTHQQHVFAVLDNETLSCMQQFAETSLGASVDVICMAQWGPPRRHPCRCLPSWGLSTQVHLSGGPANTYFQAGRDR